MRRGIRWISGFLLFVALHDATPAGAQWRSIGPFGGSVEVIRTHPTDSAILLAATKNALIYRSSNSAESWTYVPFPRSGAATMYTLTVDPMRPHRVFAGLSVDGPGESGLYASGDGGASWEALPFSESVLALALWSKDSNVMAAGTRKGAFVSPDAGRTWKRITPDGNPELEAVVSVALDPADSRVIYVGTPHLPWKTTDGGQTWESIHNGMIDDSDILSLRVDEQEPTRLFVGACSGVYRSTDSGDRWTKLLGIPGEARRTYVVTQDPKRPAIVYTGTTSGLWRSEDTGKSWKKLSEYVVKSIAFDPVNPDTLYVATDRSGIWKSRDRGNSMFPADRGFVSRNLSVIGLSGRTLFASNIYESVNGQLLRSEDLGASWYVADTARTLRENVFGLVTLAAEKTMFASGSQDVFQSVDAGRTWKRLGRPPFGRLSALYAAESGALLAGGGTGIFRSTESGGWAQSSGPMEIGEVRSIVGSPTGRVIGAIGAEGLWKSADSGATWSRLNWSRLGHAVNGLAVSDDSRVWVIGTSHGLYRSVDGGDTWSIVENGVRASTVSTVLQHPTRDAELFIVQFGSVYRSTDRGQSWQPLGTEGLQGASIRQLAISNQVPDVVFALTALRGVFVIRMSE